LRLLTGLTGYEQQHLLTYRRLLDANTEGADWATCANAGHDMRRIQDWLGHRSIQHTTRYTQLSAAPFKDFWT
jgi:integrase